MTKQEYFIAKLKYGSKDALKKIFGHKNKVPCFIFRGLIHTAFYTMYKNGTLSNKWYISKDGTTWQKCEKMSNSKKSSFIKAAKFLKKYDKKVKSLTEVIKVEEEKRKCHECISRLEEKRKCPECIICLSDIPVYISEYCCHVLYCEKCFDSMMINKEECPICDIPTQITKIYFV